MIEQNEALYRAAMQKALEEAEKGRYKTAPNPCVGAVLIKDNAIVASGFHKEYGADHAEVNCIKNANTQGIDTKGATLVVTLEPCNHYGKTPPCTKAILEAGIKKVIIGTKDPNPKASGGIDFLRSQNIEVIEPLLEEECKYLIRDFLVQNLEKRPYLILKMGTSLDGKIATAKGKSHYITGEHSRRTVAELRANIGLANGFILVGKGTYLLDNPKLNARDVPCAKQPRAALVTSYLPSIDDTSYLIQERIKESVFLTSHAQAQSAQAQELRQSGAKVYGIKTYTKENKEYIDIKEMLSTLYKEENCQYILSEGGALFAHSLFESKCVDEYRQYIAPMLFADKTARNVLEGRNIEDLNETFKLEIISCKKLGNDIEIISKPLYNNN